VGTVTGNVSTVDKTVGHTENRLLCLKDREKTSFIHVSQPGTKLPSNECIFYTISRLGDYPYLFLPFCLIGRVLKLIKTKFTQHAILIAPLWSGQPWFPTLLKMCIAHPIKFPLTNHMNQSNPLILNKSLHLAAFLVSGNRFKIKGLSERTSEIMSHKRRIGITNTYKAPWNKWVLWCKERQIDLIDSPLITIIEFLTELFDKGLEYRTINVYRSAISAYHPPIEGTPVGKIKEVCTLLSGIDNLRPPTPMVGHGRTIKSCQIF